MNSSNLDKKLTIPEIVQKNKISTQDINGVLLSSVEMLLEEKYGEKKDMFEVKLNHKTEIEIVKKLIVVAEKQNYFNEISLGDAKSFNPSAKLGDFIKYPVDLATEFSRNEKHILQVLIEENLRDITKQREFERFEKRLNTAALATVKSSPRNLGQEIIVEIDNTDCILYTNKSLAMDRMGLSGAGSSTLNPMYNSVSLRQQIYVFIYKVHRNNTRPQVFVSRTCTDLVACIMKEEIPNFDKRIEIKAIARIPGVRTKVAVLSKDPSADAVISCIGSKGIIANAINKKLGTREKVIYINWNNDLATFIANCMNPVPIICAVVVDEDLLEVVVSDSEFISHDDDEDIKSLKRQTSYDAALCGMLIKKKVILKAESVFRRENISSTNLQRDNLMKNMNISEEIADLLYQNGLHTPWDLLGFSAEELTQNFEELDKEIDLAEELILRAKNYCSAEMPSYKANFEELGGQAELFNFLFLNAMESVLLAKANILDLEDLAKSNINTISTILKNKRTQGEIMQLVANANRKISEEEQAK